MPAPELLAGRLERLDPPAGTAVLAWGETPAVEALRRRVGGAGSDGAERPGWIGALWRLVPPDPAVAARVNDRAFCLEIQHSLGCALPGARIVRSLAELRRHLEGGGAEISGGAWVAKAPLSAAGRHRVLGEGTAALGDAAVRRRLERLLERFGRLVVEPWVPRSADFGCAALVEPVGAVRPVSRHRLVVDRRGAFIGLELETGPAGSNPPFARDAPEAPGLAAEERDTLERTVRAVGGALAAAGYAGPFGIDAFRWRDRHGVRRFHPLSEINARMTFGLVGRALAERVSFDRPDRPPGGATAVALRFGRISPGATHRSGAPAVVPLVVPTSDAPGAWLEVGGGAEGGSRRGGAGR